MIRAKKISAFLLLVGVTAPFFVLAFLSCKQLWIQHEMKEKLEHAQLHALELKELNWVRVDEELLVAGRMFDVKELKVEGNIYKVRGLFDDEEKAIKNYVKNLHSKSGDKSTVAFFKSISLLYYFKEVIQQDLPYISTEITFAAYVQRLQNTHADVLIPPPRKV